MRIDPSRQTEVKSGSTWILVHVCDWLVPTRDLLLDRGMMGDGVIDLPGIGALVEEAGYCGYIEVEIFSAANWWTHSGEEVLRTCIERFDRVCQ